MSASKIMTTDETAGWLKARDGFLIITHQRPDGDTIGCAGALAQGLCEKGKTAYVLYNEEITPRYARFVEEFWAPDGFEAQHIITVDVASAEMFPASCDKYSGSVSLSIDHHPSNTNYAEFTCLNGTRASCGEIVYDILMALSGRISEICAERLYVALSTDTGCFAFGNTTANTLRVASLLIEAGAPHRVLNKTLFRTRTRERVKMESMIFSGLEFYFTGAVAIAVITLDMIKEAGAVEDDLDDFASLPGAINGVLVGITIRELSSEKDCKVSVRTSADVNANAVCAHFGGGGHPMAAGYSLNATVSEIKEGLLDIIPGFLPPPHNT